MELRKLSRGMFVVFGWLALGSCGGDPLPKVYELQKLRVLALVADNPEIDVTGTATITPFITDPSGDGRALRYTAETCIDIGVAYGATPSCSKVPFKVVLAEDQQLAGTRAADRTGLTQTTFTITPGVTAPAAPLILAGRSDSEKHNGVPLLFTFKVWAADGTTVESFRRILVTTKTERNHNPSFKVRGIHADGSPLTQRPTKKVELTANLLAGAEDYILQNKDGVGIGTREKLDVAWYSNFGTFETAITEGTNPTTFIPPNSVPPDKQLTLVTVVRDGRGGVAVYKISL